MVRLEVGIELIPKTSWMAEDPDSRHQDSETDRAKHQIDQRSRSKKHLEAHPSTSIRAQ